MRFPLIRHLREVGRGGGRANAPSRRARTWAVGSSLEGLEDRKLLSTAKAPFRISSPTIVATETGTLPATFRVSLSFAPNIPIRFSYTTHDESAKAGTDYTAVSSTAPADNPPFLDFNPGQKGPQEIRVPVAIQPGFQFPKRFVLEVDGPGRVAYGVATIIWRHPRIPHPRVSNPVVKQPFGT
jgi:hypothetical protein